MPDPRIKPLLDAALQLMQSHDYYPHFATLAERARMETVLWLARYDALVRYYDEHGVPMPEKSESEKPGIGGGEMIPIIDPELRTATDPKTGLTWGGGPWNIDANRNLVVVPAERSVGKLEALSAPYGAPAPIPMILFCPACDMQHIDAEEPHDEDCKSLGSWDSGIPACDCNRWTNPPHRSHRCASCGEIWRPADVATVGVREIETKGSVDSPPIRGQAGRPRLRVRFWRHKERKSDYFEIGRGELQMSNPVVLKEKDRMVCYRGLDGKFWLRYEPEFDDGRFERLGE